MHSSCCALVVCKVCVTRFLYDLYVQSLYCVLATCKYIACSACNPVIQVCVARSVHGSPRMCASFKKVSFADLTKETFSGPPCRIRTCGPQNRNLILYPTELRAVFQTILYHKYR